MSSRHHIDDFMRGRIIGKIEERRKITDVTRVFDIAHSVVSRLWKSFKTTGMCSRRNRRTTAQQVANQFLAASGKQISRKTVTRRLRGGGLYARRPVVCVPLTRQHRTARLQWCREHHNWTEQEWACILNPAVYLQVDDHVHPGNCLAAVSSEKKTRPSSYGVLPSPAELGYERTDVVFFFIF
ncbi:HTH_Tnp_Tc3_2 domain-containing protein [Trichonephila clavipes]|nr:HTH_Tnp_Tc3_2 domain-containing protein [Trichonephila clavipes]